MAKFTNELAIDVTPFLKGLAKAKDKADDLDKLDPKIKVDVDDSELENAKDDVNKLDGKTVNVKVDADTKGATKGLSAFGAIAGGLVGGAAIQGVTALTGAITEGALAGDELADSLEVAYNQAGIADVEGAIKRTTEANLELANSLGQDVARVDELSLAAAGLAGAAGQVNTDMTKAAIGIEQLSGGAVKGEAVIKALSRGLADPEGAAAIENLSKKYPQLAETLRGTGDAASKLAAINKELGPTFSTLEDQASGPDAVLQKLKNTLARAFQGAGDALFKALAPVADTLNNVLTPLLESLGPAIGGIVSSLAPLLQSLAQQLAPILTTLGNNLAPIIASLVKGLIPLVEGILPVFVALLEGVGPVVATIADVVGTFVAELAKGLMPAFKAIADVLPKVLQGLTPLLKTLGGNLGSLVGKLAAALGSLLEALLPIIPVLVDALVPILQLMVDVGITPLRAGIAALTLIIDGLAIGIKAAVKFFQDLFTNIVEGAKSIPILGDALAFLPKIIESVKAAFNQLVQSLPDFVKEILGIEPAADKATAAVEEITEAVDDQTAVVDANTLAAQKAAAAKAAAAKAAEAQAKAEANLIAKYQKQKAEIDALAKLEKDRIEVLRLQGQITADAAKKVTADIDAKAIAQSVALAKKVFKAEVDEQGFLIKSKIISDKSANILTIKQLFAELAKLGPFDIIVEVKPSLDAAAIKAANDELGDIQLPELIDMDALQAELSAGADMINNEFGSLAFNEKLKKDLESIDIGSIVADIFAKGGDASQEELDKQAKDLRKQLDSNVITYQQYANEIGLLQEKMGESSSALDNIFASVGAGLSAGLGTAIANMKGAYEDLAKAIEDGSATIGDSLKLVGTEAGLQFAKMIADGENVGTALLKAVGATAQKLLALYTPEILALFAATIPPPFGLIAGGAAVAGLNALLASALGGFEEGGFTGGRPGEVRGIVHGAEFVANAGITKREASLFKFLEAGGTSEQYYRQFVEQRPMKMPKVQTFDSTGAMVSVLMDVRDRLDRIPSESFMKHGVSVDVGLDTVLYQKQQHRSRVRRLR